jgi:hypothetical protein
VGSSPISLEVPDRRYSDLACLGERILGPVKEPACRSTLGGDERSFNRIPRNEFKLDVRKRKRHSVIDSISQQQLQAIMSCWIRRDKGTVSFGVQGDCLLVSAFAMCRAGFPYPDRRTRLRRGRRGEPDVPSAAKHSGRFELRTCRARALLRFAGIA